MNAPFPPRNMDKILEPKIKKSGAWQRKPDSEIEIIKVKLRRSSFVNPIMPLSTFIILLGVLFAVTSKSRTFPQAHLMPYRSPICISIAIFVSVVTYVYQIFKGRALASSPSFKVCNKCFEEDRIGLKMCPCGGTLEPPEFYSFIENRELNSNKAPAGI